MKNEHVFHVIFFRTLFPVDEKDLLEELIQESGIDSNKRPIFFTMEEIGRVCHVYDKICKRLPYIYNYDYRGGRRTSQMLGEIREMEIETGFRKKPNSDKLESESIDALLQEENGWS